MSEAPSPDELRTWTDQQLLDAYHSRKWGPGHSRRERVEDEIERRGIDISPPITPTPEALLPWSDDALLTLWDEFTRAPGDPWSDALAMEIERQNLDF